MAIETVSLTSAAVFYHQSPLTGGGASPWVSGGARKGVSNGQKEIGLVLFSKAAISSALTGKTLSEAKLRLTRDQAYGTGAVDVSLAPVSLTSVSGSLTHEQCLSQARRNIHHPDSVSGDATKIPLPGSWLRGLKAGTISGFMIYREEEEGSDAYVRFTATAQLIMDVGGDYRQPVWTRPIGRGDIISDKIRSHVEDLYELQYYLNIRRAAQALAAVDIDTYDVGLYADWYNVIVLLRNGTDAAISAEGGTAVSWCAITADQLPSAQAINELRNALQNMPGSDEESVSVITTGYTYFDHDNTDFEVNYNQNVRWYSKTPLSGMHYYYEKRGDQKVRVYSRRFGFWILAPLIAGKTVSTLHLRVTRAKGAGGSQQIVLYPLKVSSVPGTAVSVNSVMDLSQSCGSAACAVGETVDIPISADAVTKLTGGQIYGVAVHDRQYWTDFEAAATLIINKGGD